MKKTNLAKKVTALVLCIILAFGMTMTVLADDSSTELDPYKKYLAIKSIFQNYEIDVPSTSDMLDSVMKEILTNHPELFSEVINAMLKTDEKYTAYYDAETYNKYFSNIAYYGIGVLVDIKDDDYITISAVYDGPAKKAGLMVGDRIIKVNNTDVTYASIADVGTMVKGAEGTTVDITIQRPSTGDTKLYELTRGPVTNQTISYEILDNNIGYIRVSSFEGINTWIEFCNAQEALNDAGVTKCIIDVRNNGGGDAQVVFNMLNQIIAQKDRLILTIKTVNGDYPLYSKGVGTEFKNLVVLANGNSYSAAEVFAGVVKDLKLGVVVGTTTGGKGKGQQYIPFKDGSYLAVSSQEVVLPVTGIYHRKGITPSVRVENKLINPDVSSLVSLKDFKTSIKPGEQSSIVKGVEQRLNLLGYLKNVPNESFDPRSVAAVKAFQKANGMYDDGTITASVINLLNDKIREYKTQLFYEDTQLKAAISILS